MTPKYFLRSGKIFDIEVELLRGFLSRISDEAFVVFIAGHELHFDKAEVVDLALTHN